MDNFSSIENNDLMKEIMKLEKRLREAETIIILINALGLSKSAKDKIKEFMGGLNGKRD